MHCNVLCVMQSYIAVIMQSCEYNCFQLPLLCIFNYTPIVCCFDESKHYFDTTVGFLGV